MKTIKSKRDFESVFSRGKRINNSLLRLRVAEQKKINTRGSPFFPPKRLGNAVYRNRCKRVLREAARICDMPADGYDVILFSTAGTHDSSPEVVAAALKRMLVKAGI